MSDEILMTLTAGNNIPFVDEDGPAPAIDHHRARPNVARRESTKEAVAVGLGSRCTQSFATFRSIAQSKIGQEIDQREGAASVLQKGAMFGQKVSSQHRYVRQSPATRRSKNEPVDTGSENPLQRYENAVLKYQKPKARPKRQSSRDRQQQQQNHGYSSSDESVVRNKSKSISSIDTQSVNNILDEYEDLDYRRSSDLSDVGSISVSNFEAVMMDQQKKQQQDKSKVSGQRMQPKRSPVREKPQPVLKVNQQTQVRQRSRERQKESVKRVPASPTEDDSPGRVAQLTLTVDASRGKVPEVLLRKGEVQKRVDEWLSQAQSQNFPGSREKPLTRSNSSAEQKSQRRYRQDSRSRSIDEGRDKLNGTSSSYDDLSRADKKPDRKVEKVNVAVNTSRGTYKEYLALKNRGKQHDYGFSASNSSVIGRSRDISPSTGSRIPQRGPLTSSFRSRRLESSSEESRPDNVGESEKNCRGRPTNLVKSRNESDHGRISGVSGAVACSSTTPTSSSSVIPCRRASLKRSQNHDQSASCATRPLVKEETGQRAARGAGRAGGATGGGGGGGGGGEGCAASKGPSNLGDRAEEPISPNKDGESRRPTLTSDSPRAGDKAADAACKSMEGSRSARDIARFTGESAESRYTRHEKRESKMDQTRQETVYGAVGARVRTLQGQQESRVTRPRNLQAGNLPPEARKPPVLPRKEQTPCSQDAKIDRDRGKSSPIASPPPPPQSSFKPNNRVYVALQQLNEHNSPRSRPSGPIEAAAGRSRYSSPNHVEKIYERSLQPQVIHADDLESILRPSSQVSAYGEGGTARSDLESPSREAERDRQELDDDEEVYERIGESRYEHLETIEEDDQRSEASVRRYTDIQQALPNGGPRSPQESRMEPARTFVTFHSSCSPRSVQQQSRAAATGSPGSNEQEEKRDVAEPIMILEDFEIPYDSANPLDGSRFCHTRESSNLSTATIPLDELESERQAAKFKVENTESRFRDASTDVAGKLKVTDNERTNSREIEDRVEVVNEVLVKTLQFEQDLPTESTEHVVVDAAKIVDHVGQQRPIGFHNVLCDNYENVQDARFRGNKVYVTKEEMERQRLMDLLRKGDYDSVKASWVEPSRSRGERHRDREEKGGKDEGSTLKREPSHRGPALSSRTGRWKGRQPLKKGVEACEQVKSSVTIGCLQSSGSRGPEAEEGGGVGGGGGGGTSMCCVLQGAERVFPSNGGKHGSAAVNNRGVSTSVGTQDLPLESLWAAGLDEGMGFPQRCSYANHHTAIVNSATTHVSANPEDLWRERNLSYRTPTTSTGIDSPITDEIWTSANEAKFFRTSTTSTGIGSSLNLHDNNRSLESRDGDFYSTDIEDSKDAYRRFYPNTPTTSGLGSSSDRQSVETQRGSKDLPDHLWAAAMEDGFSRFNAMKSLQTITRQPRPNHDWVKTERISRFTKHRTISQSPQREQEIWTSNLNENSVSGYATQRLNEPHKCHHQARRSFSTSVVADLAVTPDGSQQSLGSGEFLELERSYTLSTPGGSSPVCCPPCSPPPAPAAYISSARASSRRLGAGSSIGGPPSPERDPLGRLLRFLKTFYRELGTRDPPHLPAWASPLPLGTLCPAHFQPHLQLLHKGEQEHRLENIKPDQIFAPVRLSDGTVSEAPRRVAIEGGPGSGRTTLCLRLLHQWAIQGDGPVLALIVPLRELRGSPVLSYLARELFPRTAAIGDAVAQVWRTLHLMEDRVLFVLDGYDECVGGRASLGDALDLLEGRLFPDARILVTCSPSNSAALSPLVQRRIHLAGLEWPHVERLCVAYFIHNDIAEKACEFLEALNVQPQTVKQLGQHPLGWIMLCCLYQDSGSLPTETSALVQAAVKCIVKRSLDPPVPYNEEIPGHCRKRLEDFGKLSLAALREGRCCYTEAELRARGGGIEVTRLGLLTKGLTFGQRRKPDLYTPIHTAVAEFLAAYYLTSVAQYANILRRELEGLPSGIISHLAGLLGPKTHLILNQLCPLEVPPRAVFSLLKAAGASDGNISAVCRLVGAGPGFGPAPNERPPSPLVHTSPLELEGWARILESPACTLEALEVVFQVERASDPRYLDDFFEALAGNESVKLVRITSLLGQEFPADEAQMMAGHLKSVLGKKKLNDFELVITCLEEKAHDRLECVVNALCRGLSHASSSLARLVLDMNLSGKQVSQVCDALRGCVQVQALHLPHLGCGCEGLASVAELLKERPLLALNLAGCWGAKNEDQSSSGISMGSGSGSGSSGCASSTLGTLPLNRCYSSLPRGALAAYGSLTRPATLPRLPLGLGLGPAPVTGNGPLPPNDRDRDSNGSSKRNSDSVLCHRLPLLHPLPTCDVSSHQGTTGFHEIFNAIREPNCKLRSLNVSKCLNDGLDAGCLGETIRRARNLDALRAAGVSRPADVMPLVLALTEAPCLQLLDLASPRLALDDHPSRLLCHALARNTTLKLLSLEGWTFRIEESDSLAVFSELLRYTSVRELSLCNARLHLAVHEGPLARLGRRDDAGAELLRAAPPPACPAIVFLRLAGFQVTVNDRLALRGPLLLPFLAGFTALSELDLSLDKSTIGGSSGSLLFINDKILQQFFACLSTHFRNLQSLRINFWRVTLEDSEKTMRQIAKYLKLCNLSFLKANGLIVNDSAKKVQMEHVFVQTILTHLQYLTWLCLDSVELTETQASSVGKCVRDRYPGTSLEISAKDVHVKSVKALVTAVVEGGRAEVVYTGGSNCRLKITKIQKNGKAKKK